MERCLTIFSAERPRQSAQACCGAPVVEESRLIKGEGLLDQMQGDFVLLKLLADGFARRGVGEQGVHHVQRA